MGFGFLKKLGRQGKKVLKVGSKVGSAFGPRMPG